MPLRRAIVGLLNSGILNPFSLNQSDGPALAALDAISAEGTTLYGGQYELKQFDASISGFAVRPSRVARYKSPSVPITAKPTA
ncbi:MAG: hypothetical protein IPG54_09355 [Sphingomonadales bacterium]|nr:hypothetical protein [Sphingomonadales bacterium]